MKTTARFDVLRERTLNRIFTIKNLTDVWRSVVRSQMRSLDILDLHDYYDFNLAVEDRAKEIISLILRGQYSATPPLIFRLEKKYGICRHIMIPSPSDALVFQTITEFLATHLEEVTPTKKAFYSRDKHHLKLPHELNTDRAYPWFILWPKFQQEILNFSDDCPYLVVTDITNFFDNIGLRELRHIVSSRIRVEEVILDLLFNIIEQLTWVPDYLPSSLIGLPTINLEAFRLLPHVMLFEIDEVLDEKTSGNFVRWMDDINFGVSDRNEAHRLLGNINDVLKSRGLALNLSKTIIYKSEDAKIHFLFDENAFLDEVSKADPTDDDFKETKKTFLQRFKRHLKNTDLKNWDKVTKRYFTVASKLKIKNLNRYSIELYMKYPGIRNNILNYIFNLGFSNSTASLIISILNTVNRYDDVTLFNLCKMITRLEVPYNKKGKEFTNDADQILRNWKSDFDLYCYLWFCAKYKPPHEIMTLINSTKRYWMNEQFLGRQVISILPRVFLFKQDTVVKLMRDMMNSGPRDAASVASNLQYLFSVEKLKKQMFAYLRPPKGQRPYPLPKYLILTAILSSPKLYKSEKEKLKIGDLISDPWYIKWLEDFRLLE